MQDDNNRKLSELIALFELEPNLRDLYTEGPEDADLIELFFDKNSIRNVQIYPIGIIDFSDELIEFDGNRDKVIFLSEKLNKLFGSNLPYVTCIIDMDFEYVEQVLQKNPYLHTTDYANLEMYFFNLSSIHKFLKISCKKFPLSSHKVLEILTPILLSNFQVRYSRHITDKKFQMVQLDKQFKYIGGKLKFDSNSNFEKFLSKNSCIPKRIEMLEHINHVLQLYNKNKEPRFFIHGKDFFEAFFLLLKKVKGTYSFNEESFSRAFFVSVDFDILGSHDLFKFLKLKYH